MRGLSWKDPAPEFYQFRGSTETWRLVQKMLTAGSTSSTPAWPLNPLPKSDPSAAAHSWQKLRIDFDSLSDLKLAFKSRATVLDNLTIGKQELRQSEKNKITSFFFCVCVLNDRVIIPSTSNSRALPNIHTYTTLRRAASCPHGNSQPCSKNLAQGAG